MSDRSVVIGLLAFLGFIFGDHEILLMLCFLVALIGIILGLFDLWKADSHRERGVAIIGILACLVSPFGRFVPRLFQRGFTSNDSAAIGDTRAVISAEAAYQHANSGYYGTLTCLATPSSCIPGYTGPTFLDASLAGLSRISKQGYIRTSTEKASTAGSPGSLDAFCYQLRPAVPGKSGTYSIGGDMSGVVGIADTSTDCCDVSGHLNTKTCPPLR